MVKRIISILIIAMILCGALAACGSGASTESSASEATEVEPAENDPFNGEDDIRLNVWAAEKAVELTQKLCDDFVSDHPDKNIEISVKPMGESFAASNILSEPDLEADVFSFASDQLDRLYRAGALAPVTNAEAISARNLSTSIQAATADGILYAYPETSDNGYYLVYDRSVISDDDAKSLESILAACRKAGRRFVIDASNGFYAAMFPFTGGMVIDGLDEDDIQRFNDYDEEEAVDTLAAFAELFREYSDVLLFGEVDGIYEGLAEEPRTVAGGIDGAWNCNAVSDALGDDYGAAKLPTIRVGGKDRQIISLHGYKLVGVSSYSRFPNASLLLADRLTDEEAQLMLSDKLSWVPSNINAISDEAVTCDLSLTAVLDQVRYSVTMSGVADTFWSPIGSLGSELTEPENCNREALRELLIKTVDDIRDE